MRTIRHTKATEPQRRFWASTAKFRCLVGGVGSGKTRAGCVELLRQPPGSVGMVIAPTYSMLRDATLRSLLELVEPAGLVREFNRSEMRLELLGKRTLLLRSADKPDRLRGPNLGHFWLDEAAMMLPGVWDIMIGRLRGPGAWRAWCTTTPRGKNWLWSTFVEKESPRHAYFVAPTTSNQYLPKDFAASLADRYDPQFAQQELEGSFLDNPQGKLLLSSWLDMAVTLRADLPNRHMVAEHGHRRISCDVAEETGRDKSVILVRDDRGILHLEASATMTPTQLAQRVDQLRRSWEVAPGQISYDGGGGVGKDAGRSLALLGISARRYLGGGAGGNYYRNARSAAAWLLREGVQAGTFGLARAGEHLPALRRELEALTHFRAQDKDALIEYDALRKALGHSPDFADCLIQSFSW